jgi:hypothetical protein
MQARMLELVATTRLVGLLRSQRRPDDESESLRAVYDTFGEGYDEVQLVAARELLDAR